jgi:hypothetical protein
MAVVLFLLNIVYGRSFEFEITPIQTHFLGCLESKGRVIVYGTGGAFWVSTDKGDSWERRVIHPFGTIQKIVSQNDTLWGIMDDGIILVSTDLGLNWLSHKIELSENDFFANLVVFSDHLFIRTKNKILKFDKKINLVDSIEDSVLSIDKSNFFDFGVFKGPIFYQYPNSELFITPNFLVANIGRPLAGSQNIHHFMAIDYNFDTIRFVDVDSIVIKRNLDFEPGQIYSVDTLNGKLFITLGSNPPILYQTDYDFKSWKCFFNDTLLIKNDSLLERISFGSYFFHNKDLLAGFYNKRSKYLYKGWFFNDYSPLNTAICVYFNDGEKESFKIKGDFFENKYYTYPIHQNFADRLSMALVFLPGRFVQIDSTFIFVGPFKTIVRVDDKFSKWELISSFNSQPFKMLNDSVFIFINTFNKSFDIDCSFDGGNLFLPTMLGLNKKSHTTYFVDSLFNIIDSITTIYFVSYLSSFTSLPVFYVDTFGIGFFIGSFGNVSFSDYLYCGITVDFFRTIKFIHIKNISPTVDNYSNVFFLDNKLCFYSSFQDPIKRDTIMALLYYILPNNINYSIDTLTAYYFDSVIKFVQPIYVWQSGSKFFVFSILQDSLTLLNRLACIYETEDPRNLKNPKFIIDDAFDYLQFYEINSDSILFVVAYPISLFLLDKKNNQLVKLFSSDVFNQLWFVNLSGCFFLFTDQGLLENTDRGDLTKWQEGKWDYGKPNFESVIFKGNVAIAGLSDSLRPFNYYKITLKKGTPSSVETELEKRYYTTKFWASEPYPQPAGVRVKARIAWDGSFDVAEAIDGVYDSMGRKVEGKERIRVTLRDKGYGELEWECSGVPSGVYFILLRWAGGSESVPVVVE